MAKEVNQMKKVFENLEKQCKIISINEREKLMSESDEIYHKYSPNIDENHRLFESCRLRGMAENDFAELLASQMGLA